MVWIPQKKGGFLSEISDELYYFKKSTRLASTFEAVTEIPLNIKSLFLIIPASLRVCLFTQKGSVGEDKEGKSTKKLR